MSETVLLKKYNEINQRFIAKFFRRTFYMQKRQVFYMMEDDKLDLLLKEDGLLNEIKLEVNHS